MKERNLPDFHLSEWKYFNTSDAEVYPVNTFISKSHIFENLQKESPIYMIKSLSMSSLQRIQGLSCLALEFTNSKSVASMICPPLNESHLMFNSEVSITFFKLSMINFGDDLVDSANNAYRPKVF